MSGEAISPRVLALKIATRDAVEAANGLDFCATQTRCGKSQLQRAYSPHDPDTISLRDALTLDRLTTTRGGPFIARALAVQLGHLLIAMPDADADAQGVSLALAQVAGEFSDVTRAVLPAVGDGEISEKEARAILPEAHELAERAALLVQLITKIAYPEKGTGS